MDNFFGIFWTIAILGSVFWYAFLLFYVGYKGGVEIKDMTTTLEKRNTAADKKTQ